MTDASTIALQQIIAQLGAIVDRLSTKSSYQDDADKALDNFKQKRADTQTKSSEKKDTAAQYLKRMLDLQGTSTLTAGEATRYTNIAKIFSKVLSVNAISSSIDALRKSNEESAEQQRRQALLGKTTAAKVAIEKTSPYKAEEAKSAFDWGNLAKLGVIAAALHSLNKLLKGDSIIGPLTGLTDVLTKWTTVGVASMMAKFVKSITTPLSMITKAFTGKSIGEMFKEATSKVAGGMLSLASYTGTFIGEQFTKLGSYLAKFFPSLMSSVSSITSIFTQTFKSATEGISKVAAGKGAIGKIFSGVLGPLAKITSKAGLRLLTSIPGIGALISFYFAYDRYTSGDTTGALIEVAAGMANLIPVPFLGSALSLGISMINAVRDLTGATTTASRPGGGVGWFTKALDEIGNTLVENCYNWPVIGPMIRVVEHLRNSDYLQALNSMAHVVPPVGWVLDLLNLPEQSTLGKDVGSLTVDKIKGMSDFLSGILMSIPGVGNVLRSLQHFIVGDFEAGFAEILPQSVMNIYRKFKNGKSSSFSTGVSTDTPTQEASPSKVSTDRVTPQSMSPTPSQQIQLSQPVTKVEMSGLNELHAAMMQMNKAELGILTEQRNLLNDNKSLLRIIAEHLTAVSPETQSQLSQYTTPFNTREELSSTRKAYLEHKNVFGSSLT